MANIARSNRFRKELLPPARIFYERELGELRRPSRGWASPKAGCPFHDSKSTTSFSVNLDSGGFYCFGCDAKGGDIVDFVMLRDKLDFKTAAKSLGCWDDGLQINAVVVRQIERERSRARDEKRQAERDLQLRYFEAEDWLYAIEAIYRDSSAELTEIRSGRIESDQEEIYWSVLALAQDEMREAESEFIRTRLAWPGAPFNKAARDFYKRENE